MTIPPLRPQRPPAPSLADFDALDEEHVGILNALQQLEELIERVDAQGVNESVRRLASESHGFFESQARQHHANEEAHVFPGLLKSGDPKIVHEVKRLQQDHGWLEEDWRILAPAVHAIANSLTGADMRTLREGLPVFANLYREHIAMEESMIFPRAKRQQEQLDADVSAGKT